MKSIIPKLLFIINYLLLIFYISWNIKEKTAIINSNVSLFISSLMLIDITYISSCNVKESKVINLFCGLLALDSWYIILSFENVLLSQTILIILHPTIYYLSIKFILMFLFQGNGYNFKKTTTILLFITYIGSLIGIFISDRAFACLYGIQFLTGYLCFFFILIYHRKRIIFVLKSEWKNILFSITFTAISFYIYYFATLHIKNHIASFGIYLPTLLLLISIHSIIMKENRSYPLSTIFSKKQMTFIVLLFLLIAILTTIFIKGNYKELFIAVNIVFAFIYILNIILGRNLIQGKNKIIRESKYNEALRQLQQEEALKLEFATFLHNDVLQDLLSIKNMVTKTHRPDIQNIIVETLDHLNKHIRKQMQDYHPVILNSLTLKENYQNLIETISLSFPEQSIKISFDCSDALFLALPYNILIYRLLKELLTNIYKHSKGNRAWVILTQENNIIKLCVSDDGIANADFIVTADSTNHKGIATMIEQIHNMAGTILFSDNVPYGLCVQITLPMKGDDSYQYFIS